MRIEDVVTALRARRNGAAWSSRCPICQNEKLTLSIWETDGKVGFRCYYSLGTGCHPIAVMFWLQAQGVDITQEDLTGETTPSKTWPELWDAATQLWHSHAHDYLQARGIILERLTFLRDRVSLRCLGKFKHPQGPRLPVMLGLISACHSGLPIGIHRTYLNHLGTDKTMLQPNKMTLGNLKGGVIRLARRETEPEILRIAEGIENALSVMQLYGVPCWSAVSAGNILDLRPPVGVKHITIYADNDDVGRRVSGEAGVKYSALGFDVEVIYPIRSYKDFNDQLRGRNG